MKVIPAINCKNPKNIIEKIKKAEQFLPAAKTASRQSWIQIDISDGKFTRAKTNFNPTQLKNLKIKKINIEIHLMAENPEKIAPEWLKAGAKRVIVHVEAIKTIRPLLKLKNKIGVAINFDTPSLKIIPFLKDFRSVLFLAVKPGFSGQKFNPSVLREIKWIKSKFSKAVVGIDGGINLETAKLVKKAGADIIVSDSYIWGNRNPRQKYNNLVAIGGKR